MRSFLILHRSRSEYFFRFSFEVIVDNFTSELNKSINLQNVQKFKMFITLCKLYE